MKEENEFEQMENMLRRKSNEQDFHFEDRYWKQFQSMRNEDRDRRKGIILFFLLMLGVFTTVALWLDGAFKQDRPVAQQLADARAVNKSVSVAASVDPDVHSLTETTTEATRALPKKENTTPASDVNEIPPSKEVQHAAVPVEPHKPAIRQPEKITTAPAPDALESKASAPESISESGSSSPGTVVTQPAPALILLDYRNYTPIANPLQKIQDPKTTALLARAKAERQQRFLSAEAGLTAFNRISMGALDFTAGFRYYYFIRPNLYLQAGACYTQIDPALPQRNFYSTYYSFGSTSSRTTLKVDRLHYLEIPVEAGIRISGNHYATAGISYYRLLAAKHLLTATKATDASESQQTILYGTPTGIATSDLGLALGYRYINSSSRWIWGIQFNQGLNNISSTTIYPVSHNRGLRLTAAFKLNR